MPDDKASAYRAVDSNGISSSSNEEAAASTAHPAGWSDTHPLAKAIFEDLADGKRPTTAYLLRDGKRYLGYPVCLEDCGMRPVAVASALAEAGLSVRDGNRMTLALEDASFDKAVELIPGEPPLAPDDWSRHINQWFALQSGGDVLDISGIRYVASSTFHRWASLFSNDPKAMAASLIEDGTIRSGGIQGTEYVRCCRNDGETNQHGE